MRLLPGLVLAASSLAALTAATAPANAACKKMGFLVNDYGKEGPTKDAQELLDKDIAKWAASQGIGTYTVNGRDVKCELFLDVILFDEHTCTASANVCWDEKNPNAPKATDKTAAGDATVKPATAKPADTAKKAAKPAAAKAEATKAVKPDVQAKTEDAKAKTAVKSEVKPDTPANSDAGVEKTAEPAKPAAIEATGAIPDKAAATPSADETAKSAAAAAERAAQAAERAAAAAERAAAAAASISAAAPVAAATPAPPEVNGAMVEPINPAPANP